MKMKTISKTTKYKFNIRRTVGIATTMRFSIGVTKMAVEKAFRKAGLDSLTVAQNTILKLNIELIETKSENSSLKNKIELLLKENKEYCEQRRSERKKIAEEVIGCWRAEIKKEKEKNKKKSKQEIFITTDGFIYKEPKEKHHHRITIHSGRGKLLLAIMGHKDYTSTQYLIEITGLSTRKSIEGAVYKIRKEIEKKLGVLEFIDGYQDYGYRINPGIIFKKA